MRRRTLVSLLAVAVAVAGCTPSEVDPDAPVEISGVAAREDGGPLADTPVALHVNPGPSVLFWTPLIIGTFGAACATDLCGADHATRTNGDGRYRFDLVGEDVQGSFGEEVDLLLDVSAPPRPDDQRGPAGRVRFAVRDEQTALPALRLWEPALDVVGDEVRWEPLADGREEPTAVEVLFQRSDGHPVWRASATRTGVEIDPRILEDSGGGVAAVATLGTTVPGVHDIELRTATRRYRSRAGAPATRNRGCAALTDAGERVPLSPCPVTDGDLVRQAAVDVPCPQEGDEPCPQVTGFEVPLGAEAEVQLVVVRGCAECGVAVGDSSTQLTDVHAAVRPGARAESIVVRGDVSAIAEVSAWTGPGNGGLEAVVPEAPEDAPTPAATDVAPGEDPPRAQDETGDGALPAVPVLVAVFLLGAAAGALLTHRLQRRTEA